MTKLRELAVEVTESADTVFQAALGVAQNNDNARILAVHNEGRRLIFREKPKMSNPRLQAIAVLEQGGGAQLRTRVGTDPRAQGALMDGKFNERALKKYLESVQNVLNGSATAPVTPVTNHYLAKKTEVPWDDPEQDPEIELDGNFLAMFGF